MQNEKPVIVQVCFSLNALTKEQIQAKLHKLKKLLDGEYVGDGKPGYELHSCHLSKAVCLNAGFDSWLPEAFASIFDKNYVCEITENTLSGAMSAMERHRIDLARRADRMFILGDDKIGNVALEIQYFTDNRVNVI